MKRLVQLKYANKNLEKVKKKNIQSWTWWHTAVISVFRKLKQKDLEFKKLPELHSEILSLKKRKKKTAKSVLILMMKCSSTHIQSII
jgi:hypothetical protein